MKIKIDKEFEKVIPQLTNEEFDQLEENILKNGIQDSIKTWNNFIIDGHNRYKIAKKHNLEIITFPMDNKLVSKTDVIIWIINNQRGRRNLSNYDRGLLALKLQEVLKIKGLENKSMANRTSKKLHNDSPILGKVDSEKQAAQAFNVSKGNLNKVKHIEEKAPPEVKEKLKSGEITVNKAYQDIKKEQRNKEREENIKKVKPIDGKYKVIYADPPWSYNDKQDISKLGGAEKHYSLMSLEDICNMPVKEKTEENAVLFLWGVVPQLEEALQVIKAWGFKYKTHFVWDKVKHNMGHYSSVRHELLFVATKGSCTPENIKLFDSVQSIEKTKKHSEKPEEFRNIINTLYPSGNRIELFARKKINGWETWGNET